MKKRVLIPALIFLIALVVFPLAIVLSLPGEDPESSNVYSEKSGFLLGTVIRLKIYGSEDPELFNDIFKQISEYESLLSVNIEDSQVAAVNRAAGLESVNVDSRVMDVVLQGLEYSKLSEGRFDITIGPLVDLWHIGHEDARIPEEAEIESVLPLIDYTSVLVDPGSEMISLPEPGMSMDLGGIAKGYIADRISEMLIKAGRESALINLGGNVLVVGSKPDGTPFRIGVQNPDSDRGEYLGIVSVESKSVVSSGAYERFLEVDGKTYHHILDPFTGYPVETDIDQVTIISERSVDGDGLSTTVFTLGRDKGMALIESIEGVDAILITADKKVFLSEGLSDSFSLTDSRFTVTPL
ncbi:MAG: FAD:protein FMN transferase [Spirochaetales bacterium]|nr:FAD:protein FMN transferase [Spirochaetales bacterium]